MSELILPELITAESGADISIILHETDRSQDFDNLSRSHLQMDAVEASLSIKDVATFIIREGKQIIIHPADNVEPRTLSRYVIGPVMAILLSQRGFLVLHASCVKIADGAVAFLGEPGMGKSSMAAALYSLGYPVISDDVTAVHVNSSYPLNVFPASPQIKLDLEATSVFEPEVSLPDPVDRVDGKFVYKLEGAFCNSATTLSRLYVLEKETRIGMERLSSQEAIKEVLKNSYPTRWDYPGGSDHFLRCATIVSKVPIYRIGRAPLISALRELANEVAASIDNPL